MKSYKYIWDVSTVIVRKQQCILLVLWIPFLLLDTKCEVEAASNRTLQQLHRGAAPRGCALTAL